MPRTLTEPLAILRAHTTEVHALAFVNIIQHSSDTLPSISLSSTSTTSSSSISTPEQQQSSSSSSSIVSRTVLLSGSIDGTIVVWDTLYYQQLASWYGHSGGVLSLATVQPYAPTEEPYRNLSSVPVDYKTKNNYTEGTDEYGIFFSQGRDGCIHQWKLSIITQSINRPTVSSTSSSVTDNLAFLDDILQPSPPPPTTETSVPITVSSSSLTLPSSSYRIEYTKLQTIKVGFGSFCRMNLLYVPFESIHGIFNVKTDSDSITTINLPSSLSSSSNIKHNVQDPTGIRTKLQLMEEEEDEGIQEDNPDDQKQRYGTVIIAPSLDAAKLSVWYAGSTDHPAKEICLPVSIAPMDAIKVSETLGRKQPLSTESSDDTESSTDILQGLFRQSGMVMCTQLIPRPTSLSNQSGGDQSSITSAVTVDEASTTELDAYIQQHYRTIDGSIIHPDASSLKDLLKQPQVSFVPSSSPSDKESLINQTKLRLQQYRSTSFTAPFLVIACYENGALYVIDPLMIPFHNSTNYNNFIDNYNNNTLPEIPALFTLPVSTDPLLTFSLVSSKDYSYGVVGTAGTVLYTVRLEYELSQGTVLQQINLPSPGCSVSVPLPTWFGGFNLPTCNYGYLMGCWDNEVRYIHITENRKKDTNNTTTSVTDASSSSSLHSLLQWHRSSIQSVAVMPQPSSSSSSLLPFSVIVASGSKDGRVALWSMTVEK